MGFKIPTAKEFSEKLNEMSNHDFDAIYHKLIFEMDRKQDV